MNMRQWILAGMFALPALAWADDAPVPAIPLSFDFHGDGVRKVISEAAASQYGTVNARLLESAPSKREDKPQVVWQPVSAVAAPRTLDHYDCNFDECLARDQDHNTLHTVPVEYPENQNLVPLESDGNLGCLPSFDALSPEQRGAYCKPAAVTSDYDDRSFGESLLDDLAVGLLEGLFGGK